MLLQGVVCAWCLAVSQAEEPRSRGSALGRMSNVAILSVLEPRGAKQMQKVCTERKNVPCLLELTTCKAL